MTEALMTQVHIGYILCLTVFWTQIALAYHITAGCIQGRFPRRDVLLMPLVLLTIASVLAYVLREALILAPEIVHLRTEAGLYVACLGEFVGLSVASVVHRKRLIQLAQEARENGQREQVC